MARQTSVDDAEAKTLKGNEALLGSGVNKRDDVPGGGRAPSSEVQLQARSGKGVHSTHAQFNPSPLEKPWMYGEKNTRKSQTLGCAPCLCADSSCSSSCFKAAGIQFIGASLPPTAAECGSDNTDLTFDKGLTQACLGQSLVMLLWV